MTILNTFRRFLPPPLRLFSWREHPLDGKLLLFERNTGLNVLLEGEETAALQRIAPRTLLIAVTNVCNLSCPFCFRDLTYPSDWTFDNLLEFCQQADEWGVLEVAFGGGEPMWFPRWEEFIHELYATTRLGINFTTNGMRLTGDFLDAIAGKYGQIRVSLYDTNHWTDTIRLMVKHEARFGVNWLITPEELDCIQVRFDELMALGVRDFLLLGYKGDEFPAMHFAPDDYRRFSDWLNRMYAEHDDITLKLDVCWGKMLPDVPRLFIEGDCGAGDDFLSLTSHKQIKLCSFHPGGIPFDTLDGVRCYWERTRHHRVLVMMGGCGRLPARGLIHVEGGN